MTMTRKANRATVTVIDPMPVLKTSLRLCVKKLIGGKMNALTFNFQGRNYYCAAAVRGNNINIIFYITFVLLLSLSFLQLSSAAGTGGGSGTCIETKVGSSCKTNADCYRFNERHLYCNRTHGGSVCAFQVHTYASQSEEDKDCPGKEFSAEPWSNPISFDWINKAPGIDCMRLCLLTKTCFAVSIVDHECYLKNDKCFSHLKTVRGALFGVLSVTREDYHCGCHYPFTRQRSNGEILSWDSDCPESQLNRNPYRCCSAKGLCVKCENGMVPNSQNFYDLKKRAMRKGPASHSSPCPSASASTSTVTTTTVKSTSGEMEKFSGKWRNRMKG